MSQEIKGSHPLGGTKEEIICQKPLGLKYFRQASVWGNSNSKTLGVQKDAGEERGRVREGACPPPKGTGLPQDHRLSCMQTFRLIS